MSEKKKIKRFDEDKSYMRLDLFEKYRRARASYDLELAENEQWWLLKGSLPEGMSRNSAWTFNSIAGKHADAMDNIPTPAVLPREPSDVESAAELSEILPALLGRNGFTRVWSDCWYDKLRYGAGVYGVFWDNSLMGGLGDVSVRRLELSSLYFEPGVSDVQDSSSLFYVTFVPTETVCRLYPALSRVVSGEDDTSFAVEIEGMNIPEGRTAVIDRYYKKRIHGRKVLHFCRSVRGTLVYASEKDPLYAERGYYDHGLYPVVFDPLYDRPGSPCGFGIIDIAKGAQEQIDRLESALVQNSRMAAARRYFARESCGINEEEFTDWSSPIVHYSGSGDPSESVMPIEVQKLDGVYLDMLSYKVDELKETSGNRDFNQGSTSSGVTAASAIAALQEAGNKLSRDMLAGSYHAFEQVCTMMIELIRQFYTLPRCFRITGDSARGSTFRDFDNSSIVAQKQGVYKDRLPMFDITVRAERQSPYSKAASNELAEAFFKAGFFAPEKREEALLCLEMMDFDGRDRIAGLIRNGMTLSPLTKEENKAGSGVSALDKG